MRVENCSTLNFKGITNTIGSEAGDALLKRVKSKNISKFADKLDEQASNPVQMTFFFKEGANPNRARFRAKLACDGYTEIHKQGLFTSTMKFFEKMCKKADKINEKRSAAEKNGGIFVKNDHLGCGKCSSINALEE